MAREEYSSDKRFTIQGRWWRPNRKRKVAGTLTYDVTSIHLELLGAFDDGVGENPFERDLPERELPVIQGQSAQGTPITLLKSFYQKLNWEGGILARPPHRVRNATLVCNALLIGTHLPLYDEKCFSKCRLVIPNLDRWLDDRPFDFKFGADKVSMEVRFSCPPRRTYCLGVFGKVELVPSFTPPVEPWDDVALRNCTYLDITTPIPHSFSWWARTAGHVQRLFTLIFGKVVQATHVHLSTTSNQSEPSEARIFLPSVRTQQVKMNPMEFVFRFPTVRTWFRSMLESWFTETDEIQYALDLVFASLEQPGHFLETKFLPFAQAVEVYSRSTCPGRFVDKSDFKRIRKDVVRSIPEGVPNELKEAITRSISWANEWSLRDRIMALMESLDDETCALFSIDRSNFVRGIVDTRNHLTHFSSPRRKGLSGVELHWTTFKLQLMMRIVLLIRLGIPEDVVRKAFASSHTLSSQRRTWLELSELGAEPRM